MQRNRPIVSLNIHALSALAVLLLVSETPAALVDHYTLDNTSTAAGGGRTDISGNSAGAGTLSAQSGTGAVLATTGIVGGALAFPNSLGYQATVTTLTLPLTLSVWINTSSTSNEYDAAFGITDAGVTNRDFNIGVIGTGRQAAQIARNLTNPSTTQSTPSVSDGQWHHVVGVFQAPNNRTLYLDGKVAGTSTLTTSLWAGNSTTRLNVGGSLRQTGLLDAFNGSIDDAGVFNNAISAADVALINGLGQTGGIGLDQLDEAQTLDAAPLYTPLTIGGVVWYKVDGLSGTTGDFGGSTMNGDAFIITNGDLGLGISNLIPEPHSVLLLAIGSVLCLRRRAPIGVR